MNRRIEAARLLIVTFQHVAGNGAGIEWNADSDLMRGIVHVHPDRRRCIPIDSLPGLRDFLAVPLRHIAEMGIRSRSVYEDEEVRTHIVGPQSAGSFPVPALRCI